jgi:hypothetical protein
MFRQYLEQEQAAISSLKKCCHAAVTDISISQK